MEKEYVIKNVFRLSNGISVIACEGRFTSLLEGHRAKLMVGNNIRQIIALIGSREIINWTEHKNQSAIETYDSILLTVEEAQSGQWSIVID